MSESIAGGVGEPTISIRRSAEREGGSDLGATA